MKTPCWHVVRGLTGSEGHQPIMHRVDRVLGFFSSRPNWDPPLPHTQKSVYPPPFGSGGGGTLACGWGGGGGGPIQARGQTLWLVL